MLSVPETNFTEEPAQDKPEIRLVQSDLGDLLPGMPVDSESWSAAGFHLKETDVNKTNLYMVPVGGQGPPPILLLLFLANFLDLCSIMGTCHYHNYYIH